ncbi:MAG: hypothetical protein GY870_19070 [archaeon]|nr:hypothetical protein [archaeon]
MVKVKKDKKENKKSYNKEKTFSLRIDQFTINLMNIFSQMYKISKSKIARKSIRAYITLNVVNEEYPNPKLLFSKNMLRVLLNGASEHNIEKLAEVSFINGIEDVKFYDRVRQTLSELSENDELSNSSDTFTLLNIISKMAQDDFDSSKLSEEERYNITDSLLKSLILNVFTSDGQNWFDSIDHSWENENVTFTGNHQLGENFSLFMKILMIKYLDRCGYNLLSEDYTQIRKKSKKKGKISIDTINYEITIIFTPK